MKRWFIVYGLLLTFAPAAHAMDQGYTNFKSSITLTGVPIFLSSSPFTLSGSTNNYVVGPRPVVRSSATVAVNITGFAGGRDGVQFSLINVSTNTITIVAGSTQSSSGNRIATDTGSNVAVSSGSSLTFWYDAISSLWRVKR